MRDYKVIRIYRVKAETLNQAIERVRADGTKYLESEFAKEAEVKDKGWGAVLTKQLFGHNR